MSRVCVVGGCCMRGVWWSTSVMCALFVLQRCTAMRPRRKWTPMIWVGPAGPRVPCEYPASTPWARARAACQMQRATDSIRRATPFPPFALLRPFLPSIPSIPDCVRSASRRAVAHPLSRVVRPRRAGPGRTRHTLTPSLLALAHPPSALPPSRPPQPPATAPLAPSASTTPSGSTPCPLPSTYIGRPPLPPSVQASQCRCRRATLRRTDGDASA